jgi:hypothetical protein
LKFYLGKRIKALEDILGNKTSGSMDLAERLNKFMEENASIQCHKESIQEIKKLHFQAVNTYLKELKNSPIRDETKAEEF